MILSTSTKKHLWQKAVLQTLLTLPWSSLLVGFFALDPAPQKNIYFTKALPDTALPPTNLAPQNSLDRASEYSGYRIAPT